MKHILIDSISGVFIVDQKAIKKHIQQTFDTICKDYDCQSLRFFNIAAAHLPDVFDFRGDEHLLDIAAGTGIPATICASMLLDGSVTAVDFSSGMLAQAEHKAKNLGLENISFHQMDMTDLALEEAEFDAANCSFGLFFVEDMVKTLSHIASRVKPGGLVVTTHFLKGSFSPLIDLFLQRVRDYGIEIPPIGWKRLETEVLNRELYLEAGLEVPDLYRFDVGYHFDSTEQWWDVIWNAGYRGLLMGLNEEQLARFKAEHLVEIAGLNKGGGIPFHIEVVINRGKREL